MKLMGLFVALLALVGCNQDGQKSAGAKQVEKVEAKLDHVKAETREAVQAAGDYAFARKNEFVTAMKGELESFRLELEVLEAKAKDKARIEAAREKWARTKAEVEAAEGASEANWEAVKAGVKSANADMKASVNDARQWVADQIAP